MDHFTFWISLSLGSKSETKRLNFGLSPELRLTNCRSSKCRKLTDAKVYNVKSYILVLDTSLYIYISDYFHCRYLYQTRVFKSSDVGRK